MMVKSFKTGTVVKQGSDSKLLDNHIEQGPQDETQDKSDSGGSPDPEPTRPSAIEKMPPSPSKFSPTLQLIKELEAYQRTAEDERWPCAIWPEEKAFEDAYVFIQQLDLTSIPTPIITLADDGEVNFFWENESVYVDLGFYGTGAYSYFACHEDGRKSGAEIVLAQKGLHPEILQLFSE